MPWRVEAIQELVLNEHVEFMIPIAYAICFAMAYYGPNAEILGGIKNSYWQFEAVEDFITAFEGVAKFFLIDTVSVVITSVTLWMSCRINITKVYKHMMKEFWSIFTLQMAYMMTEVSNNDHNL